MSTRPREQKTILFISQQNSLLKSAFECWRLWNGERVPLVLHIGQATSLVSLLLIL